jgi:hypothetical protein
MDPGSVGAALARAARGSTAFLRKIKNSVTNEKIDFFFLFHSFSFFLPRLDSDWYSALFFYRTILLTS